MTERAKVVVIGGGVIGLSVAYHLAKIGCPEVLLLERNELTSGTSWHAAGIIGPLRASMNLTRLAIYATELFGELERETGKPIVACNAAVYWQTLRGVGIEDKFDRFGRLLAEH